MMNKKRLKDFISMSRQIGARNDYVQGGGGNTSVKLDSELMAIKASGYCLRDVGENCGFSVVNYHDLRHFFRSADFSALPDPESLGAEQLKGSVRNIEGLPQLRPSVETGFHSLLDTFVIHSHSLYANMAACSSHCCEILQASLQNADYSYAVLDYQDPGTKLALAFKEIMEKERPDVFFMKNHGVVVHHDSHERCIEIHEDLNRRISNFLHVRFREMEISPLPDDRLSLPEISGIFSDDDDARETLLHHPLFPDQIVFLDKNVLISKEKPQQGECSLNIASSELSYAIPLKRALVVAEVITAVSLITSSIKASGHLVIGMKAQDKSFIDNWESEKYRKSLT